MEDQDLPPTDPRARFAYYERRRLAAEERARVLIKKFDWKTWPSDPGVRAQVRAILAMPPAQRLEMLMAELSVFDNARPAR